MPNNDNLTKYYEYLKGAGADVPPTVESFTTTLQDPASAKTYYDYVVKEGYDAPPTFESFSSTLLSTPSEEVKKKEFSVSGNGSQGLPDTQELPLQQTEVPDKPLSGLGGEPEDTRSFEELIETPLSDIADIVPSHIPTDVMDPKIAQHGDLLDAKFAVESAAIDFQKLVDKNEDVQIRADYHTSKYTPEIEREQARLQGLVDEQKMSEDDANAELNSFMESVNARIKTDLANDYIADRAIEQVKGEVEEKLNARLNELNDQISVRTQKEAVKKIEQMGFWEGIGNSLHNEVVKTKMLPAQAMLYSGQISEDIEGDDPTWTITTSEGYLPAMGSPFLIKKMTNRERQVDNYRDIKRYEDELRQTLPVVESLKKGNYAQATSGVISNTVQFLGSIVRAIPTAGSSAVFEMGTPMYIDAVEAKAEQLNQTPEEIISKDLEDEATSMTLGAVAGSFEMFGLGTAGRFLKNKVFRQTVKEGVKKELKKTAPAIWKGLKETAVPSVTEALTETGQGIVEEYNRELQGKGIQIGTKGSGDTLLEAVAKNYESGEMTETAVATLLGSALMFGGAKGGRAAIDATKKKVETPEVDTTLEAEVKLEEPVTDKIEKPKDDIQEEVVAEKPETKVEEKPTEEVVEEAETEIDESQYQPPLKFTQTTPEKYAVMNRGDGKGDVVITEAEYNEEIARRPLDGSKPVEKVIKGPESEVREKVKEAVKKPEPVVEEKVEEIPVQDQLAELNTKRDEIVDDFGDTKEIDAQIAELQKQLPKEEVVEQELTAEEKDAKEEAQRAEETAEFKEGHAFKEIEETFTPISIEEYEAIHGKGMYKENKGLLKGLVTKEGSKDAIDNRSKEGTAEVEYHDPQDIMNYIDAVAFDRSVTGDTKYDVPKQTKPKRKPRKPVVGKKVKTSDFLKNLAAKAREGKMGDDIAMSGLPGFKQAFNTAVEVAAQTLEATAYVSDIVDFVIDQLKNNKEFMSGLKAAQKKAMDLESMVAKELGLSKEQYLEDKIQAEKKKAKEELRTQVKAARKGKRKPRRGPKESALETGVKKKSKAWERMKKDPVLGEFVEGKEGEYTQQSMAQAMELAEKEVSNAIKNGEVDQLYEDFINENYALPNLMRVAVGEGLMDHYNKTFDDTKLDKLYDAVYGEAAREAGRAVKAYDTGRGEVVKEVA